MNIPEFFRVVPEPGQFLEDADVHRRILRAPGAYLAFLAERLRGITAGRALVEQPEKQVFEDGPGAGDFRLMPCVVRRNQQVFKSVKIVGTNLARRVVPGQIAVGKALVLHPTENFVTHSVDANLLSSARTGACAVLALRALCPGARRIAILGAGRVGAYVALLALTDSGIDRIDLLDIDRQRAEAACLWLAAHHQRRDVVAFAGALPGRLDAVIVATTSERPLLAPPAGDAGLVVSLGADTAYQRELSDEWISCAEILAESADCLRYGDLKHWLARGLIAPSAVHLWTPGTVAAPASRPRVFISTGSALMDNLTLQYLLGVDVVGAAAGATSEMKSSNLRLAPRSI